MANLLQRVAVWALELEAMGYRGDTADIMLTNGIIQHLIIQPSLKSSDQLTKIPIATIPRWKSMHPELAWSDALGIVAIQRFAINQTRKVDVDQS